MVSKGRSHPIRFLFEFYVLCFICRAFEYLVLRTDQTVVGEAFLHKLIGIAFLAAAVRALQYQWPDIGFRTKRVFKDILLGLLLGCGVFTVAYGAELLIVSASGNAPSLQFYVTSYSIVGNRGMQDGLLFILICIAGNIINVVMEEGVFRGLFLRVMEEKYSFIKACLFSSILFGVWHIAQPVRNLIDGVQSPMGALISAVMLITASTLLAIQYCMLFKITGSVWAGMAAHFVNNASANLLHVSSTGGVDQLQTMRIAIAQSLSFAVVLVLFLFYLRRTKTKKAGLVS